MTLTITIDIDGLRELNEFAIYVGNFERNVTDLFVAVAEPIRKNLLDDLRTPAPAKTTHDHVWSENVTANAKARRWWFWAISTGLIQTDGENYIRTGGYVSSWGSEFSRTGSIVSLDVTNSDPDKYRYVSGGFDADIDYRNPTHKDTGWKLQRDTVQFWFGGLLDDYVQAFNGLIVADYSIFRLTRI